VHFAVFQVNVKGRHGMSESERALLPSACTYTMKFLCTEASSAHVEIQQETVIQLRI